MAKIGHYGTPALILAGGAALALILHLAVPYGVFAPDGGDTEAFTRGDVDTDVGLAAPGTTLAGVIIALVAGLGIAIASFIPMPVHAARFVGWGAGAIGAVGSLLVLLSSMLWVGDGLGQSMIFTTVGYGGGIVGLFMLITADTIGNLWVIGPVLVAVLGALMLGASFRLATDVVKREKGMRDRATNHVRSARWAIVLVAVAFVLPWSIATLDDTDGRGTVFVGAHTAMNVAEQTDGAGPVEAFQGMSLMFTVFVVTAWVALAMGLLGALGGVLASVGAPAGLSRATHFTVFGTAAFFAWSAIMYILAWATFWNLPEIYGAQNNMPGFAPILLIAGYLAWARNLWTLTTTAIGTPGTLRHDPATFD